MSACIRRPLAFVCAQGHTSLCWCLVAFIAAWALKLSPAGAPAQHFANILLRCPLLGCCGWWMLGGRLAGWLVTSAWQSHALFYSGGVDNNNQGGASLQHCIVYWCWCCWSAPRRLQHLEYAGCIARDTLLVGHGLDCWGAHSKNHSQTCC